MSLPDRSCAPPGGAQPKGEGGAQGATPLTPVRAMNVCLGAQIASIMPVFLLGALAPLIHADVGFGPVALGSAVAVFYGASALGSLFLAPFADTAGVWRVARSALGVVVIAGLAMTFLAQSVAMILVVTFASGVMNGCIQPTTNVIVSRFIPGTRQGLAYGLKQAAIPFSTMLGGVAVPVIGLSLGWRWAFLLSVLAALVVLSVMPWERGPRSPRRGGADRRLENGILVPMTLMMSLAAAASNAMAAFMASSITAAGHSAGSAGMAIAAGSLFCVAVRIGLGVAADRWRFPLLRTAGAMFLIGGGSYLILAFSEGMVLISFATLLAFGFGWGWAGLLLLAIGRASTGAIGASTGITHAGVYVGGVVGPIAFGWVAQTQSFALAWQMLALVSVVTAGLSVLVSHRLRKRAAG